MSNVNVKPNPLTDRTWIGTPNPRSKTARAPLGRASGELRTQRPHAGIRPRAGLQPASHHSRPTAFLPQDS